MPIWPRAENRMTSPQSWPQVQKHLGSLGSRFFRLWGLKEKALPGSCISTRLRRSLGTCNLESNEIRLHPTLLDSQKDLLEEVYCHELAHLAVFKKYGLSVRPHGPEWQALVREAGYEPNVRLKATIGGSRNPDSSSPKLNYRHYCPVCQTTRSSRRPQPRWRCAECVEAGLSGDMTIQSYPLKEKSAK